MSTKKYEDAYCKVEEKCFSIDEVAYIFNNNLSRYANNFDKHMVCPFCKEVPFSFVNVENPYFRGYPRAKHSQECIYATEEISPKVLAKLSKDSKGRKSIVTQMEWLLRQFLDVGLVSISKSNLDRLIFENNENSGKSKKEQIKQAIPRKQITATLEETDLNIEKIFYGKVHIAWENPEIPGKMKLLLKNIQSGSFICRLLVPETVYTRVAEKNKVAEFDSFVLFFSSLSQRYANRPWYEGSVSYEELILINKIKSEP